MPVVIAALNAYSGLAACGTGFVFSNLVLIISGSLVGASGLILTRIMCRAMNRSFVNVIFGTALGGGMSRADGDAFYEGRIKTTSAEEVAMVLESARSVMIVPGYGMAVSQAQHAVRDLSRLLDGRGIGVSFAIHPVAGRMPGHMNVLLAEADIPYDKLNDLDAANAAFDQVDVAIVIGANDVVNPEARENPDSPIAGMPILNVDKAKTVVVIKRSLSPGFAGIANPLFVLDHTLMLFGDGKAATMEITAALKEGG
jgi:NAD(P) transhydrogenase subunit beta